MMPGHRFLISLWFKYIICLTAFITVKADATAQYTNHLLEAVKSAITHNPSEPTIQTNAGHFATTFAFSCDGRYLFTANKNEICIRERASMRVIKTFPFYGTRRIIPSISDPNLIGIYVPREYYTAPDKSFHPITIIDWKKGKTVAHVPHMYYNIPILPMPEHMFYMKDEGYVPFSDPIGFLGQSYHSLSEQKSLGLFNNDSILYVDSKYPYYWDLTRGRLVSGIGRDTLVSKEEKIKSIIGNRKIEDISVDYYTLTLYGNWKDEYDFIDIDVFDNGRRALAARPGLLLVLSLEDEKMIKIERDVLIERVPDEWISSCKVLPDGRFLIGTQHGNIKLYDPIERITTHIPGKHNGAVVSMTVSKDGKKLFSCNPFNCIIIRELPSFKQIATIYNLFPGGILTVTPDQYYSYEQLESPVGTMMYFSKDNRTFPLDQFDLTRNRPDIIVHRIGGDSLYVSLLELAHEKRLRRMGVDIANLSPGFEVPDVEITNAAAIPSVTFSRNIRLNISASDSIHNLSRLFLSVNGVPQYGDNGLDISRKGHKANFDIDVELTSGVNTLSVKVLNSKGALSSEARIVTDYHSKENTGTCLYVVTIGVSRYSDARFSLGYAAKDARDIATLFTTEADAPEEVKTLTITDEEFTSQSLKKVSDFLKQAGRNDAVIFYYAGHGVLDNNLDYWLAPSDMDFSNPSRRGIDMESINAIFEGLRTLKRYVLLDACHSGTIDKDDFIVENTMETISGESKIRFRNNTTIRLRSRRGAEAAQLAEYLFSDISTRSGITFVSSSQGNEVSVESDEWENGLFTHALKTSIPLTRPNGSFEESFLSIKKTVEQLSEGKQHPSVRLCSDTKLIIKKP